MINHQHPDRARFGDEFQPKLLAQRLEKSDITSLRYVALYESEIWITSGEGRSPGSSRPVSRNKLRDSSGLMLAAG